MKNRIITNSLRTIKKSFSRFIPLFVMSFLGVLVFAGLQSTKPDMLKTLDNYLDEHNVYDIKIVSTLGLTNNDIQELKKVDLVENVEGSYEVDTIINDEEENYVINIASLPDTINNIDLIDGRMPANSNEIVVEENLIKKTSYKIGDTIKVDNDILKEKELTIVGTINSALYFNRSISPNRGTTSIGTGTIHFYTYVLKNNFNQDYYNNIYITVNGAKDKITSEEDYTDLISNALSNINAIKNIQEDNRYNEIYQQYAEMFIEQNQDISSLSNIKIEHPTWYIYDRTNHQTYNDYIDDITSVNNLSKIFPLVFFAVAILVSLISMNRMVEEDRIEIGSLKALGFTNHEILIKYLLFSMISSIFGGILGGILGIIILPSIIFSIYGMLFNIPNFYIGMNMPIIIISLLVSTICICGTTIITVYKVLKEKPSELMRPKAPAKGKRILLEKIKWLWNKINFSNKITLRNLFRYKKRGIVTIIGIAGCSALMLCGFGIRDAIIDIASMQYEQTFKYDATIYINSSDNIIPNVLNTSEIKEIIPTESINVKTNNISATLIVGNESELDKIVNLVDKDNNKIELTKGKVVITDKFADLNNLHIGDTIELMDDNNTIYKYEISNIAKNYIGHYIYIDEDTFTKDYDYNPNVIYLNLNDLTTEEQDNLQNKILKEDNILNMIYTSKLINSASDMLKSLNKVVLILIILSSSLAFIVLYNLSNININERKREISTLKVLGFYDKEVDNYITKENIIFTFFGILLGLILGYFLTSSVITTVEIEKCRFIHHISLKSYIYTIIISSLFTFIVNTVAHFHLKKIDMIASLKSVD